MGRITFYIYSYLFFCIFQKIFWWCSYYFLCAVLLMVAFFFVLRHQWRKKVVERMEESADTYKKDRKKDLKNFK